MEWLRFIFTAALLLLIAGTGCAGRISQREVAGDMPNIVTDAPKGEREAPAVPDDSLALVDHVGVETHLYLDEEAFFKDQQDAGVADPSETNDKTQNAPAHSSARHNVHTGVRSPRAPAYPLIQRWMKCLSFCGVWGYRSDVKTTFRLRQSFSAGLRTGLTRLSGYAQVNGFGAVETIALGNLRAHFGEGLILGRRDPDSSPICYSNKKGEFRISSSLSRWEQSDAAAIGIRAGGVHAAGLLWKRPEAETGIRQGECWGALSFARGKWWTGAAMGLPLSGNQNEHVCGTAPRAVTIALRMHGQERSTLVRGESVRTGKGIKGGFSGEIAWLGDQLFFTIGAVARGRGDWWLRMFRQPAPVGFGGSVNGLLTVIRVLQGGAFRWGGRFGRTRAVVSLYDGSVQKGSQVSRYRRCAINLSGRPRKASAHAWGISTAVVERHVREFRMGLLDSEAEVDKWNESRLRLWWEYDQKALFSHYLRLDLRFGSSGRLEGVVATSGGRLFYRWIEIMWRVTNYTLAPGRAGFISRPGVGPFEYLSAVYRDGSDISLRVKIKAVRFCEILMFYGRPWEKEKRLYVGIRL